MDHKKSWIVILINVIMISALLLPSGNSFSSSQFKPIDRSHNQVSSISKNATSFGIQINEVMFYPSEGEYEWVELENRSTSTVKINGWGITDEDGNWFHIPEDTPEIPSGVFVVLIFDGQGSASNDFDFNDNVITLHSQPGLTNIFEDDADQAALYSSSYWVYLPLSIKADSAVQPQPESLHSSTIQSFVAWGADPGADATDAAFAELWGEGLYKDLREIGELSSVPAIQGQSLGLLPESMNSYTVENWSIYQLSEVSQGQENLVPGITIFDPVPGATIDSVTFAIGWKYVDGAPFYQFQMDNNSDFSSPEYDVLLTGPSFVAGDPVPEGKYYWRVKVIQGEHESSWSTPIEINSLTYPVIANVGLDPNAVMVELGVVWQLQRKDTNMVCLAGDDEVGYAAWDAPHPESGAPNKHGGNYCERASVSMLASYYGGDLSQERIAFNDYQGTANDLGHGLINVDVNKTLQWAGIPVTRQGGKPDFATVKSWIDDGRPFISLRPGHFRVVDGYREFQSGNQTVEQIHLLDPWNNARWVNYADDATTAVWVGPSVNDGAPDVRSDEDVDEDGIRDTMDDSDGDGLVDFDELNRFNLNPNLSDTDGDGVPDKLDMREYVFDYDGAYKLRTPDVDQDKLRKERDPDNDRKNNDGASDGCEDANRNGKQDEGESSNFDPTQENACQQQISVTGKWYWAATSGPWNGYFYITQTGNTFSGTLDDIWEGTYGDLVIDGVIEGTSFSFTRDGYYGIQYWRGTIDTSAGVMKINDGQWQKEVWPDDYWEPFYAEFISPSN